VSDAVYSNCLRNRIKPTVPSSPGSGGRLAVEEWPTRGPVA